MYLEACGLDGDRVAGCLWPDVVALPLDEPLISQYPGIDKYLDHRLGGATRVVLKACAQVLSPSPRAPWSPVAFGRGR
jgi:hypothetical protein